MIVLDLTTVLTPLSQKKTRTIVEVLMALRLCVLVIGNIPTPGQKKHHYIPVSELIEITLGSHTSESKLSVSSGSW